MNHARLVCNQKEKFQCAECRKLTSNGFQLIGNDETKFVCKECYTKSRMQYPTKGRSIKHLLPAELVFSGNYDPTAVTDSQVNMSEGADIGYIGELVPDGNGGWREPSADEIQAMNSSSNTNNATSNVSVNTSNFSTITVKYRFTTDNKLQVVLPKKCRINERTYELIVNVED